MAKVYVSSTFLDLQEKRRQVSSPLVRAHALNSAHDWLRSAAVFSLAEYFRDDPQVLPLLHERVLKSTNFWFRSLAISTLVEHFRDDSQTLQLLRDRVVKDESPRPDDKKKTGKFYVRVIAHSLESCRVATRAGEPKSLRGIISFTVLAFFIRNS